MVSNDKIYAFSFYKLFLSLGHPDHQADFEKMPSELQGYNT